MKAVNIDWCLDNDDYINLNEQDMLPLRYNNKTKDYEDKILYRDDC